VLARYAARYSVRANDVTVDATLLWVGVVLAVAAAVLLAFVPRLPSSDSARGLGLSSGSVRMTSGTNRRLKTFAVTQIAASFLLLAGAGALLATLIALQGQNAGINTGNVLAVHVPLNYERPPEQTLPLYREALRQIGQLPGVQQVAVGTIVPWREAGAFFDAQFMVEGYAKADGEDDPRAAFRTVSPGFFASLGVPFVSGRDFNANDRSDSEKVVIISDSLAKRMFPNQDAVNRKFMWTDPVMKFIGVSTGPRRVIGVVADLDDENIVPGRKLTVYHPMEQEFGGGRLFVHASVDPYSLVTPITKIIRGISAEQPVEQAATLEDVRAEVLAPNRLNTMVFGGFAMVALTIAIVGVAGVLAFSVSARMREFGVRLAIGSTPTNLLTRILREGAVIATAGIVTGVISGFALLRFAGGFLGTIEVPGAVPLLGAAVVLIICAVAASLMPAARASRVDVMQALRTE
jgi:predicted permease